jgi:hypothetical protein
MEYTAVFNSNAWTWYPSAFTCSRIFFHVSPLLWRRSRGYVLEQEGARVVVRQHLHQHLPHLVPRVGLALHHALSAEGLAREAGAEHVVGGYGRHVQCQGVAARQAEVVVGVVQGLGVGG